MDKPSTSKKTSHRQRSPIDDLIKCFCGACETFFKRKHIKKALKANEQETLEDPDTRAILKKFLEFKNAGSHLRSAEMKIIECYELADSILFGDADASEYQTDLEDLCFTEEWEDRLSLAMDEDSNESLDDFLNDLMVECSRRLGEEPEYQMFKTELRRKLKLNQ